MCIRDSTSSRLQELLADLIGNQNTLATSKMSLGKNTLSQNISPSDNMTNRITEKGSDKSESFSNIKD